MKVKSTEKLKDYRGGVLFAMYSLEGKIIDELQIGKSVEIDTDTGTRMCAAGLTIEVKASKEKQKTTTIKEHRNGH